ncbi:condensation domain-containing protein [Massilia aquatica]|uniref:Carrier domain-containing protein n=1 Tax=Massilia aquatica TaxID=2609000 RepID=A0ABX0MCI9_9BURK|nr:condensation domain-containing protein [Massilia aquatica]NHZ41746.1 hypothetical protein [Massilia aquatica]
MHTFANQPIAIIGIAAALPGAGAGADLAQLAASLEQGRDLVAPVPPSRRRDGAFGAAEALSECALLERIDLFDHGFFGMSLREARQMDPQQRLLLQLSCKAIWDAGHALDSVRGSRTAVVFGAASESYSALLAHEEAPLVTGLLPAAQAGRVAYQLDLHGPAFTLDTACSSALGAILEAARLLASGEAEMALTGGVRLMSRPPLALVAGNEGILSPGARARSFDQAADGTALGEGGVVYLLKPLAAAQRDGDPVHAVILGGARNQDGGRSNGFAAPSAEAQEQLLVEAWRAAGVNPLSIGLIEAHGTGTRLGDPIEYKALSAAFARSTARTGFCVLGSVKSNIGHLDSAAGAAGVLKAVLALKHARRYASAHFRTPNPLLESATSALLLSDRTQDWPSAAPRRAGVSAFGMTGTNVHLVLEQAPPQAQAPVRPGKRSEPVLALLAAHSAAALRRHAACLAAYLEEKGDAALADLAWVQAAGRDHGPYRATLSALDGAQAAAALHAIAAGTQALERCPEAVPVMLLAHEGAVDAATADACLMLAPGLRPWCAQERARLDALDPALRAHADALLHKLVLVRTLLELGVSERNLIGHGSGNLLLDVLRGQSSLAAAAAAAAVQASPAAPDAGRLAQAFAAIAEQGEPVYLAPWPGQLATAATQVAPLRHGAALAGAGAATRSALLAALAVLYRCGVTLDWQALARLGSGDGRRASVPTDLFEALRCWTDAPQPSDAGGLAQPHQPSLAAPAPAPVPADTEQALAAIWRRLLETGSIDSGDDFFDLGGDSLMQTQLANAVKQAFGVDLDFNALYDHPTLAGLAAHIRTLAPQAQAQAAGEPREAGPQRDPGRTRFPASHSQRRMWLLQQLDPQSGAYNVSAAYGLDGALDPDALRTALQRLAARHDILRSAFALDDGELTMLVHAGAAVDFEVAGTPAQDAAALLLRHAARPFDLAAPGAWRVLLLQERGASGHGCLQLVLHHAICDEWSLNLLLRELECDYAAALAGQASPVAPPKLQFGDWAAWERSLALSPQRQRDGEHWQRVLADAPATLALPTDFPPAARQDDAGAWLPLAVPAALTARLREAARAAHGTLFTWLLTGYAAWLARLTQSEDFLIGVPSAGRHHPDAENLPGCFINTLPIRIDASGEPSFRVLFERVRGALNAALEHQRHPFDLMVEQVRAGGDAARSPLVQTLVSLQGNAPGADAQLRLGQAALRALPPQGTVAWFDLSAVLWETAQGGLEGILAYRSALFERATIDSFWQDWCALLEAGLLQPDDSIHHLLHDLAW